MGELTCQHDAAKEWQICIHLFEIIQHLDDDDSDFEYVIWFNGKTIDQIPICDQCRNGLHDTSPKLVSVCQNCYGRIGGECYCVGVAGQPGVPVRKTDFTFSHKVINFNELSIFKLLDIQPIASHHESKWIALTEYGALIT
jgi:hypothetical protein